VVFAAIPSPSEGVVHLGPVPLRAYALMIVLGVVACVWLTERRLRARGFRPGIAAEIATWAVPFGIVGSRIYHVITSPDAYFGKGGDPVQALEIWKGGLGIWGAIAGGAVGAYIACRRRKIDFAVFADIAAPGLAVAQGIGRWGNWFNQELYGRPTHLPWAVRISDPDKQVVPGVELYHPTFLYESLWDLFIVAGILLLVDRRWRLGKGRLFALYVAIYTAGRGWIEALRIDEAHKLWGLRINDWVSIVMFVGAVSVLLFVPGRRAKDVPAPAAAGAAGGTADAGTGETAETAEAADTGETAEIGKATGQAGTDSDAGGGSGNGGPPGPRGEPAGRAGV
jgi:prolipoprotein diacylglyceryl transferase